MRKKIVIALLCLLPTVVMAKTFTMDEAIEMAKKNNRDYALAVKQYSDNVSLVNRKNSFIPSIGVSSSASTGAGFASSKPTTTSLPNWNGLSYSVGLSTSLSLSGSSFMDAEYKRVNNASLLLSLENSEVTLKETVIGAYLDIDLARENLNVAKSNLEAKQRAYETTKESYLAGLIDQISLVQAENAVAAAQYSVTSLESELNLYNIEFANLAGIDITEYDLEDLADVEFIRLPSAEVLFERYQNSMPTLKTLRQGIDSAQYAYKSANVSRAIPTVSVSASYGASGSHASKKNTVAGLAGNGISDSLSGSVGISIPVSSYIRSSSTAIAIDTKKNAVEDARKQYENSRIDIAYQLEQTVSGLKKLEISIGNLELALNTAQQLSSLTEEAYANGLKTLTNLLDSQYSVYSAAYELVSAKGTYLETAYKLALYLGTDLKSLAAGDYE